MKPTRHTCSSVHVGEVRGSFAALDGILLRRENKTLRVARTLVIAVAVFAASTRAVVCQETGFLNRSVTLDDADYRYQVYVPREFQRTASWPVILALHGGGQYGRDGVSQTAVGLAPAIRQHTDRFPAIVVFPQSPPGGTPGFQALGERIALAALDKSIAEFNGNPARIYLTGLSMGEFKANGANVHYTELAGVGHNAWDPAYDRADLFIWLFNQMRR